tara:strand:- start:132 stop:1097 length:966 start_codon:yes stop_codon:yes gene_type:complete
VDLVIYGDNYVSPFSVKNGEARAAGDESFILPGCSSNLLFPNIWNIPFVVEGAYQRALELTPCNETKIVFAAYEFSNLFKQWRACWDQSPAAVAKNIRTAYPNAIILSTAKERKPIYNQFSRQFYENCDVITLPYGNSVISDVQSQHHSTVHSLPFPYLIHHIRSLLNSVSKKPNTIFLANNQARNYKQALEFGKHLQKKYGLALVLPSPNMRWEDWLREIAQAEFCLNMDNTPNWGQVAIECAMLDCLHLGGKTDAAEALFPETATNDEAKLEFFVERFLENTPMPDFQQRVLNRHSFEAFRSRLSEILKSEGYSPNLVN